jgi:heme exporter protein B
MLAHFWFMLRIELLLRLRRSQEWLYPLGFFVIVVSLFPLAFTPDPEFLRKYIAGCIWIAALLASLLSIETLFLTDLEDGSLEQQLLSPTSFTMQIIAKLLAQWLVTELPLIILTPILGLMFHLSFDAIFILCVGLLIGTPIFTLIGALGVALTLGLRQPGMLLGLLILPLTSPVLIFGVSVVQQTQAGFAVAGPLAFIGALCVIAMLLLPMTIAAAIKISVDH